MTSYVKGTTVVVKYLPSCASKHSKGGANCG